MQKYYIPLTFPLSRVHFFESNTVCFALTACGSKTSETAEKASAASTDSEQPVAVQTADSSAAQLEDEEDDPTNSEEFNVSVRTFDMDSQDPGPGYEATVSNKAGKTIQVLEGRTEGYPPDMLKTFGEVWQTDINFDGHTDVLICLGWVPVSDQHFVLYDAWLFNPTEGKFICSPNFRDIYNPEVDREKKRILSHYIARDGVQRVYSALYWQPDGSLQEAGETWVVK